MEVERKGLSILGTPTDNAIPRFDGTTGKFVQNSGVIIDDSNNVGIGTAAPTHTLTLPSTSTGLALYNTVDRTTNYERGLILWSSNILMIGVGIGGSGTARSLKLHSVLPEYQYIAVNPQAIDGIVHSFGTTSTASSIIHKISGINNATGGVQYGLSITPNIQQTSTAGYTALIINPTETTTGSGSKVLFDAQVGSSSKFKIDNAGSVTLSGSIGTTSSRLGFSESTASNGYYQMLRSSGTAGAVTLGIGGTMTQSSSTSTGVSIVPTYNQSGTASSTDIEIIRTETALGSGSHYFANFKIGSTSKFNVSNTGNVSGLMYDMTHSTEPTVAAGHSVIWSASGSGTKDGTAYEAGDVLITSNVGSTSKTLLVLDYSVI
jgi:hypothetical protein